MPGARAALEHQLMAERGVEQDAESCDHPDVFLEHERRVRAFGLSGTQGMTALFGRQALKQCFSHAPDAWSAPGHELLERLGAPCKVQRIGVEGERHVRLQLLANGQRPA